MKGGRDAGPAQAVRPERKPEAFIVPITQATSATFVDLYFEHTFLFFVQVGSKRVLCPLNGELIGDAGDVLIFPPGSMATMENRPVLNRSYRADGLCLPHDLVDAVFCNQPAHARIGVQILRTDPHRPAVILDIVRQTLEDPSLPPPIRRHRLLEPLIWLREHGVRLAVSHREQPLSRVRQLIETDLGRPWRASDAATHFAMSEATFRRWLRRSDLGFSKILSNTRLERGLALLQTTEVPISAIALECGFKTPSHFADAFRIRFGITPRQIRIRRD